MEDRELVTEYRGTRDPDLFRVLVERYQEKVYRLVVSILGPAYAAQAEEVTQEVFLQVHQKFDSYREEGEFSSWLYRIAWNRAADHRRRARFQRPFLSDTVLEFMPGSDDPHAQMELNIRRDRVLKALEHLPHLYRTIIHLYYWLGCSLLEIQELTGVPQGTSKSYLARARALLERELVEKEGRHG